jgi:hypothetical protein
MKRLILILFAIASSGLLSAQQSVTINEPAEQCYQDLKATLPEAIRWDDAQMMVTSRPLVTNMSGNVQVVARIFQEEKNIKCKLVLAFEAPTASQAQAFNATNSSALFRNASLMKAKIESAMKAREKKEKAQKKQ